MTYIVCLKGHGDCKPGLEEAAKQIGRLPGSEKTRQQVFSYNSNWNRRYPPILDCELASARFECCRMCDPCPRLRTRPAYRDAFVL